MAVRILTGTSKHGLVNNATPVNSWYPYSMGCWYKPDVTNQTGLALSIGNTGISRDAISVGMKTGQFYINADNGTQFSDLNTSFSSTNTLWAYMVARFISATNRRLSFWHESGNYQKMSDATNVPAGTAFNQMAIGFRNDQQANITFQGSIEHVWFADSDIAPDSAADLPDSMFFQMAYHGPTSIPGLATKLIDYLPLTGGIDPVGGRIHNGNQFFRGKYGFQEWVPAITTAMSVSSGERSPYLGKSGPQPLFNGPLSPARFTKVNSVSGSFGKWPPFNLRAA